MQETELQTLTLAGVAHRCAQESELFFRRQSYDPRFCFELFRRAILERNQLAWSSLYTQYRPLVAGWVERHSSFATSGEETQYFVNRAFEQMWSALNAEKFARFPDLKALLRYLQMCVHSAIIDSVRGGKTVQGEPLDLQGDLGPAGPDVAEEAIEGLHGRELWAWIETQLNDEKERLVLYGSFALALKPREIYTRFAPSFRDVSEVYRVKENVLARLRRAPELRKFAADDA
jgi:hypothetical protein